VNKKYLITLLTAIAGIGCIYYFMAFVYNNDKYGVIGGALVMLVEMILLIFTGAMFASFEKTRGIGQGILLGAAITFVIGFGICTYV
jgi:hypothetical protein